MRSLETIQVGTVVACELKAQGRPQREAVELLRKGNEKALEAVLASAKLRSRKAA